MVRGEGVSETAPVGVDLVDWVARRARTHPEHIAIEAAGETLTYDALDRRVEAAAAVIRSFDLGAGAPVALLAGNGLPFAVVAHAVPRAGALFMPLNVRLSTDELAWQLRDAGAGALLAGGEHVETAQAAAEAAGVPIHPLDAPAWTQPARQGDPERPLDPDEPHSLIYTSGTTGRPKGALLTFGNYYWSAIGSAENLGVRPDDRWLACMPLFHVGGLSIVLRSAIYGTTAVIHDRFDEVRVDAALRDDRITLLSVVATMLHRLFAVDARPYPSTLRAVLLGGGPAPRPLLEVARDRGVPVLQTYGLTETASQAATLAPEDALRKLGSAGLPLPVTTLRIEVDGREAAPGEVGEILVAGPTVTPGYLNRPDATAEALRDGWLHTGDLGYRDDEGYLYVSDRRHDLVVTGGENVYPAEVEAALLEHPAVEECAVIARSDPEWGHLVVAVVVPSRSDPVEPEELRTYLRSRLAAYKVPRHIWYTYDPLPRTASGKLQRYLLRDHIVTGDTP
ncbi:MAG: o-succinylbenzoate--CoA ligase [Acidimicrobiia bacterium]|nr:o-succinylbenzoate--CoA ligase [Acidimicrobiia bacterium]MPZ99363.1 o-succinylbenzoate--CoA ligase [Dehalococcoidia bacterium]